MVLSYNVRHLVLDFMMDLEKSVYLVMSVSNNEQGIKDIVIHILCQFHQGNLNFVI